MRLPDFSSRLISIRKNKKSIKVHKILSNPLPSRFWYGKSEWFDGNDIKQEYDKIKNDLKQLSFS